MIDVEKQRQQGQHLLLPARQPVHGPPQAPLVERQETLAQLAEHLAVNALIKVGADFVGVVHRGLQPAVWGEAVASLSVNLILTPFY
ncbi:hypothetical protein D3C81_771990 [compost metagenome]